MRKQHHPNFIRLCCFFSPTPNKTTHFSLISTPPLILSLENTSFLSFSVYTEA
uniref:Uncharacterized protein n=1 Tax=Rhizophora mucronata TaxID=61149 RepID=A0A2P2PLI0_RHIMU